MQLFYVQEAEYYLEKSVSKLEQMKDYFPKIIIQGDGKPINGINKQRIILLIRNIREQKKIESALLNSISSNTSDDELNDIIDALKSDGDSFDDRLKCIMRELP